MNKSGRRVFMLSLLFTFLAISQLSAPNLVKITNSSPVYALNSKAKILELIANNVKSEQQDNGLQASGHFANNQIQNGSVTWIQGGLWYLAVHNNTSIPNQISKNTTAPTSPKAAFSANFTMVKPDGSESHIHSINNFVSNDVIIGGGDMVITGIGNVYSDGALRFKQVPITVHLMGRQHVLGLIIDTVKTENHYASTHEMFGTLINGTGLEKIEKTLIMPTKSQSQEPQNRKSMNMPMNMG
ncbi:MAG: hypothetical protein WA421_16730 [Nitrososphaeraceae archaeon]